MITAGNGLNVDERLKAARERREEHQRLLGKFWTYSLHIPACARSSIYVIVNLFVLPNSSSASRERSRLEREQQARRYHEQQLQERRRKLLEQRLKEERRRAAVEEKRKQRLREEKVRSEYDAEPLDFSVREL